MTIRKKSGSCDRSHWRGEGADEVEVEGLERAALSPAVRPLESCATAGRADLTAHMSRHTASRMSITAQQSTAALGNKRWDVVGEAFWWAKMRTTNG